MLASRDIDDGSAMLASRKNPVTDDRTTHIQASPTFMAKLQLFIGFFFFYQPMVHEPKHVYQDRYTATQLQQKATKQYEYTKSSQSLRQQTVSKKRNKW